MVKTLTIKVSTVGMLRLRSAAVEQGQARDVYEWARRFVCNDCDALSPYKHANQGLSWSDRGLSGGSLLTGTAAGLRRFKKHAMEVNYDAKNRAILNMVDALEAHGI